MASNPPKWSRKRPADEGIDPEELTTPDDTPEDFKIKTLDEILQEKRRRIEKDDELEEETSEEISKIVSPAASGKRESRTSSKQGSPREGGSEIIYQLSPEQLSLSPMSSTNGTPNKVKTQLSHDEEAAALRLRQERKTTEEEEGEIVSDPSDSESKKSDKRRRYSSSKSHDIEEGTKEGDFVSDQSDSESRWSDKQGKHSSSRAAGTDERPKEGESVSDLSDAEERKRNQQRKYSSPKDTVVETKVKTIEPKEKATAKSEESSEEDSNEEDSEDDTETATATKRVRKEMKEPADAKEEGSESESESDDSSSDDDDDEDDNGDDKVDGRKERNDKIKEQKAKDVKSSETKDVVEKGKIQTNEESTSEEESDEEGDSDSSEESEQEERTKKSAQKTEQVAESSKVDEFETEDLHSELQQLKRQRPADEKYKQKSKAGHHYRHSESSHRKREQESSDARDYKERKVSDKEKTLKYVSQVESSRVRSESKGRPHEKSRSGDKGDGKQKDSRDKHKSSANPKDVTKGQIGRTSSREKYSEVEGDRERKTSRKDTEKRRSPEKNTRTETKSKDRKERSETRKKTSSDKVSKDSRVRENVTSSKPKKDEGPSLILTERERRQFSNEIVDIESEGSSEEGKPGVPHSDSEMKEDRLSDDEQEKEEAAKLPPYYPAIRGCRNVEEFQWLNRIEEGTYGVVYRAKDRRTGDIVALKKLKMEREKEGFPITSLREINTLLKAQHPNIVTVREIVVGSNMDKIYIVMDYVEHDLKVLMEHMTQGFRIGEVKTLMIQLLRAVDHLHDNWILHRDLKASNLLLSNKGILKVGDFGLAREYGSPLKSYTPIVVTLWYRAPELLLGTKEYSTPIDLWSVGCVFAELLTMKPLFPGKSEIDQINRIFKELGTPSDKIWPGPPSYSELPAVKKMTFTEYPFNNLRNKFGAYLTDKGFDLLNRFLTYDPKRRIAAADALNHEYFNESPLPVDPSMFPTWPAKSEMAKRPKKKDVEHSPQAPEGGAMFAKLADEGDSGNGSQGFRLQTSKKGSAAVVGFTLKF